MFEGRMATKDLRPSNLQERMTTKSMLKPVKRLVFLTTKIMETEEGIHDSKRSKLLKSEMICVLRDYTDISVYKINATESRDVRLESDHTIIVNRQQFTSEHVQQYSCMTTSKPQEARPTMSYIILVCCIRVRG